MRVLNNRILGAEDWSSPVKSARKQSFIFYCSAAYWQPHGAISQILPFHLPVSWSYVYCVL